MRTSAPPLLPLIRSELQARILALLLLNAERDWTQRELQGRTGATASSVLRELGRVVDAGVVMRDASSRPHRYRAAEESPLFDPLSTLLERTLGVEIMLATGLGRLGAERAFIHGSWANGSVGPASDVDVVFIGDVDADELRILEREIEASTARHLDTTVLGTAEFESMLERRTQPLVTIMSRPVKWIDSGEAS